MERSSRENRRRRSRQISHVNSIRHAYLLAPPLLLAAFIFYFSSQPAPEPISSLAVSDKFLHAAVYFVLGVFVGRALAGYRGNTVSVMLLAFFLAALYGISDEIHQVFVYSRFAEVGDALADAIGAAGGAFVRWRYVSYRQGRNSSTVSVGIDTKHGQS